MRTLCKEITVKFRQNSYGHNNQRITLGDGPTACHRLAVQDLGHRLIISFLDSNNQVRKVIGYPTDVIQEYTLDAVETAPVKIFDPQQG